DPNGGEIALKSLQLSARDNCTDVAIWPNEHPGAGFKTITVPDMSSLVDDVSSRTERVDVQTRAHLWACGAIHLIAEQCPMWTLKETEQAGAPARRAANRRIRRAMPGSHPGSSQRSFQGKRRFKVAEVQLLCFATAPHASGRLQLIEELGR